jgi:peptidyl-prolyl cis-trans isomerase D
MMKAFRSFAKSWLAKVLFAVLALSFIIWGANTQLDFSFDQSIISAGDHKVADQEFSTIWQRNLRSIGEREGRPISNDEAVKAGVFSQLLDQMAVSNALLEMVHRLGVRPSDELVGREIARNPAFMDPITRTFSKKTYEQQLRDNGYRTSDVFEEAVRDDLAEQHFASGVLAGLTAPKLYAVVLTSLSTESRSAAFFSVDPRMAGMPAQPTDAQLTAFLNENAERLRRPELRAFSLIRFSTAALAPTLPVDEAEVAKHYEATKASRTVAEKRSFVQVSVRSPAEAQQVAARLNAGEDPQAVAKAMRLQAIPYTDAEKGAVIDQRVADAAFSLQQGQTSGLIQGALGPAVVKVTKITPGKAATLEEARAEIVKQLQEAAAQEKIYADAAKYDELRDKGSNLHQAAQAIGTKVYAIGPLTKDGRDQYGRPNPALTQRMLDDAFSTPQGGETDLIDIGKGEYYALRVEKITPAALPTLAEVRGPLMQAWMQREMVRRMQARADQLAARVRAGEPIEKVAQSAGAQVRTVNEVSRVSVGQHRDLGQPFLVKLFDAKPRDVYTAQGPGFAISVARVTEIKPGDPGFVSGVAEAGQSRMNQDMADELGALVRLAAKERIEPKIDRNRALRAIGVAPEKADDAGAAGKAAPKTGQ